MINFGRPRQHPDGSIQYPNRGTPPPEIDGYERDPKNPFRFIPRAAKCVFRQKKPHVKPCGALTMLYVCGCRDCEIFGERIEYRDCVGCEYKKSPPD